VHVNERASTAWENQVLFRDYLLAHPRAVEAYNALKLELTERYPRDRAAYTAGKGPFIERVLLTARVVNLALSLGASLAGVARGAELRNSPSHREGGGIDLPAKAPSLLVLALAHTESEPELDWWGVEGGSAGNRKLRAISDELAQIVPSRFGVDTLSLPYRPGVYLKDAAVLAGLGTIGANNLLITPEFGPRVRLRALLLDVELAPSGPIDFAPCDGCGRPCRQSCPRQAFASGTYARSRCRQQMDEDESNPVAGKDGETGIPVSYVKYCRACELACVIGRT
jgi:epoxyqueuosine reductase